MSAKSRAGNDRVEREQFLRHHGFNLLRSGKGSHAIYEHAEMKELAHRPGFKPPEHMKDTALWQVTLCADPAAGTWRKVVHQVEAVEDILHEQERKADKQAAIVALKTEFNQKVRLYYRWKKDVKHEWKAGVPLSDAPVSFVDVEKLRQQKQSFKFQA